MQAAPRPSHTPEHALPVEAARRFTRHRGPVTSVAAIPGTTRVLASGYDGALGLFDHATGEVRLLGYHRHLINNVIVDEAGTRAATCSSDYSVGIWDLRTLRPLTVLLGHYDDVESFVFVDEDTGVSASRDRRIHIWDLRTGRIRNILEGHTRDVLSVSAHAGRIYSSGDDMTLRTWELSTGRPLMTWGPFEDETDTCALDPLRGRAVLGCDDGHVRVFDLASGALLADLDAHRSGVKKVAVSPTTGDILSAAYDQRIRVWDAATLTPRHTVQSTRATWERSLTWSPDGARILAGTFDGTVLCFDAETGALLRELGEVGPTPGNACLNDVAAGPEGRLAVVSDDGYLRAGRLDGGEAAWTQRLEPEGGRVLMNAVALSADGRWLAGGTHDGRLAIYAEQGGRFLPRATVAQGQGPINSVRFRPGPEGRLELFVACYSGAIVRTDDQGRRLGLIEVHEGAVKALRLHPERPLGVSCGADQHLLSWTLDGALLRRFKGHGAIINDVDLSPDGQRLASVSRDFTLKVYDLDGGHLQHSLALGRRSLKSVCFWSEDRVLVGDYWGQVLSVDLRTGRTTGRHVARNGVSALCRHAEGVVAVSYAGCAVLIDPVTLEERARLDAMEQRLDLAWEGTGVAAPSEAPAP